MSSISHQFYKEHIVELSEHLLVDDNDVDQFFCADCNSESSSRLQFCSSCSRHLCSDCFLSDFDSLCYDCFIEQISE